MTRLRFFRYILCCVLFFSAWEVCARVDDYLEEGAPLLGNYSISAMLTHDKDGVTGRPYGHFGKWKLNALGFRGPDVHPDTLKIICVGASETFGMAESAGMEYPRQLERILSSREPNLNVETVNVAYAGQSLRTFSRRVDQTVDALSPRMAIVYPSFIAYINDSLVGRPEPMDWVREPQGFHSRILEKLGPLVDHMPQWAENLRYRYHIWRVVRQAGAVRHSVPQTHVDQFRADLRVALDRLQQRHVCPVLVTHATFFGKRVDPEERYMLTAWRRFQPTLADDGWLDLEHRMNAVIRQEARQRHLPLVEAARALSGPQNFSDPVHFTNRGANAMANLVADKLVGSESQSEGSQPSEQALPLSSLETAPPHQIPALCAQAQGY